MAYSCCNPFSIPEHESASRKKSLRTVQEWMIKKAPNLSSSSKICDGCRKKLSKVSVKPATPSPPTESESEPYIDTQEAVTSLNVCLNEIGETLYSKRKTRRKDYSRHKMEKITKAMERTGILEVSENDGQEIIRQLKSKFRTISNVSEQLQLLTILPQSWTVKKIQQEFQVSSYLAQKSKTLAKEKGIFSLPDKRCGRSLPQETIALVHQFYLSDSTSRVMPGRKDYVSVREGGKRVHLQKRLILSNLRELYQEFKCNHSDIKIGFSKFAELRPKQCVLAGSSGTHCVCVCTTHQNVKLMLDAIHLQEIPTYHYCLPKIMCNPPTPSCFLGDCPVCPDFQLFKEEFVKLLEKYNIDQVVFKQWVSTDRSTLETYCHPAEEFTDLFCEKLEALRPHSFLAKEQASYFAWRKLNLQAGEVLVNADFSENYSFVLQDAAQGFHWNNSQATIHPFAAYYMDSADELKELNYVIISDCLHHDTVAVYVFQKCFLNFLKTILPTQIKPTKLIYYSDGAASQYKNRKNFVNLCLHHEDFGIAAEWHFSATSHGKGVCDGLGGTVKRLAARASLQRPYNDQIMTPRQLYDWASTTISNIHFGYSNMEDYARESTHLQQRFLLSRTIPGTRKYHSFVPLSTEKVLARFYSESSITKEETVTMAKANLSLESIAGFVTCRSDGNWWLACVIEVNQVNNSAKVTLLHPHGPANSFKYPGSPDIQVIPVTEILTLVDPRTTTGRVYTLTRKEASSASEKFRQ